MRKEELLNLPKFSEPIQRENHENYDAAIKFLIKGRMNHCKSKLKEALNNNTAKILNEITVVFPNGHFHIPLYEMMEEFLEKGEVNALIAQQALRHYLYLRKEERTENKEAMEAINNLGKIIDNKFELLENILTEMMIIL